MMIVTYFILNLLIFLNWLGLFMWKGVSPLNYIHDKFLFFTVGLGSFGSTLYFFYVLFLR